MKSNVIFVKFHTRLQSTDFVLVVVLVLVLVPRPYKILIHEHEDEDEKNPIRSHAYALRLQPYTIRIVWNSSFFFDQTGRSRPEAALNTDTRHLKPSVSYNMLTDQH